MRAGGRDVDVEVIGAGVVGLTCAVELARAGWRVGVVADRPPAQTTSAVAAAIWFPYEAAPAERVLAWGGATLRRLLDLAGDPAAGVVVRGGVVCHRSPAPDLGWTAEVAGHRPARDGQLPPGVPAGTWCALPVVEMDRYLAWLQAQAVAAGVAFAAPRRVRSLEELQAPVVVVAAGLGAQELLGDDAVHAVRGQVVRVANPGIERWLIDDDHADGITYIIPRGRDVVLGGTADRGAEATEPDPAVEAAILARTRALEPALADAPITSRAVGLRPARPAVRLDRVDAGGRTIVHCYGHGGAGVTLSWGCAADVVALVGAGAAVSGARRPAAGPRP
jgi:D-amino-acid oxidase